jgi:hypothetical protein
MGYRSFSFVSGEQVSISKWNILGTNDAHFYSFLGDNLAWQTYTPTLNHLVIGNGTLTAAYVQLGKAVHVRFSLVVGSSTVFDLLFSPDLSLPVAPSNYNLNQNDLTWGTALLFDTSANSYYPGIIEYVSIDSTTQISTLLANATYSARQKILTTAPFTWGTGDYITGYFCYEGV